MNFGGPSKTDQRFLAAPPKGIRSGTALRLACELLQQWKACLPPEWSGLLFPFISKRKPSSGAAIRHAGLWWSDSPTTGSIWNAAIKRWTVLAGIKVHLTFHCLRVGGASAFLREFGDIEALKRLGGWTSDVVFIYCKRREARAVDHALAASSASEHAISRGAGPAPRAAAAAAAPPPAPKGAEAVAAEGAPPGDDQDGFEADCGHCGRHLGRKEGLLCDGSSSCTFALCSECHPKGPKHPLFCGDHLPEWPVGSWTTSSKLSKREKSETLKVSAEGKVSWIWGTTPLVVANDEWNPDFLLLQADVGDDCVEITWSKCEPRSAGADDCTYRFKNGRAGDWLNGRPMKREPM